MLSTTTFLFLLLTLVVVVLCDDPYYVIIPAAANDKATNDGINSDINSKTDSTKVFRSHSDNEEIDTLYWWAPLNDDAKNHFAGQTDKIRIVADIGLISAGEDARVIPQQSQSPKQLSKREVISQPDNSPYSLRMISTAEGQKLSDVDKYYYDDSAGKGIRVYIIDSGLNTNHKEFKDYEVDWMYAGADANKDKNDADTQIGHGTSMTSAAMGIRDGVVKKASLTIVKADKFSEGRQKQASLIWLDGLKQVYDEAKAKYNGKAVVSMSWGFTEFKRDDEQQETKALSKALRDQYAKVLKPLIADVDVPAFVAAGNNAQFSREVDTIPAVLAGDDVPDLIVVGGVGEQGKDLEYLQTADYVKVTAGGEDVETAKASSNDEYEKIDGTSPATAMTAGLAAYFMGLGKSGADARKEIYDKAFPRAKRSPNVIWNGVDTRSTKGGTPAVVDVDGGKLQCVAPHDDGDLKHYFNPEGAYGVVKIFCEALNDNGGKIMGHGNSIQMWSGADGKGTDVQLTMEWKGGDNCPPMNWGFDGMLQACQDRLRTTIDGCDLQKRTSDSWKQGGVFNKDCVEWTSGASPF